MREVYRTIEAKRRGYSLFGSREIWWVDVEIEHEPTESRWFVRVWPTEEGWKVDGVSIPERSFLHSRALARAALIAVRAGDFGDGAKHVSG